MRRKVAAFGLFNAMQLQKTPESKNTGVLNDFRRARSCHGVVAPASAGGELRMNRESNA